MNQRGNIALYVCLTIVGVVLVLGAGMGIRYYNQKKATTNLPTEKPQTSQQKPAESKQVPLSQDETKDWKVYRNDRYGFEFKYPPTINGKPTIFREIEPIPETGKDKEFIIFESSILISPSTGGETGRDASYLVNKIQLSITDLKKSNIGFGIDLGGQGGRIYKAKEGKWYSRENSAVVYSWNDMFNYFKQFISPELGTIQTASGQVAFGYVREAFESTWEEFDIFEINKPIYLNFYHEPLGCVGSGCDRIEAKLKIENQAIREALGGIIKTLRFF